MTPLRQLIESVEISVYGNAQRENSGFLPKVGIAILRAYEAQQEGKG